MEEEEEELWAAVEQLELEVSSLQVKLADAEALAEHWEQMYYEETTRIFLGR